MGFIMKMAPRNIKNAWLRRFSLVFWWATLLPLLASLHLLCGLIQGVFMAITDTMEAFGDNTADFKSMWSKDFKKK